MKFLKLLTLLFTLCLGLNFSVLAHGDDEIELVDFKHILQALSQDIQNHQGYTKLPGSNSGSLQNIYTFVLKDGKKYQLTQSSLSKIFSYQLALNHEVLDFHCHGGCESEKRWSKVYINNLYQLFKQNKDQVFTKDFIKLLISQNSQYALYKETSYKLQSTFIGVPYEWITEEVPELLWKSVGKVRSLGAPFVIINAIGEALDVFFIHSLHIPVPFCTVINTASFWISEKVKSFYKLFFKKQQHGWSFMNKWKTFQNLSLYKKSAEKLRKQSLSEIFPAKRQADKLKGFKKRWAQFLNSLDKYRMNFWQKNQQRLLANFMESLPEDISLKDDFYLLSHLDKNRVLVNEVFNDQFQTIQNWMDMQVDYYLEAYHEKEFNFKQHMKIQWRLGAVENTVHNYKASMLNIINDPKLLEISQGDIEELYKYYLETVNLLIESASINPENIDKKISSIQNQSGKIRILKSQYNNCGSLYL